MNRRVFLSLLPIPFIPIAVLAKDEVEIPVEDCPCCCSDDEGVTYYSCDEAGVPLDGDPANCASLNGTPEAEASPEPEETPEWTDPVPVEWPEIDELPNTGSGPTFYLPVDFTNTDWGDWLDETLTITLFTSEDQAR